MRFKIHRHLVRIGAMRHTSGCPSLRIPPRDYLFGIRIPRAVGRFFLGA